MPDRSSEPDTYWLIEQAHRLMERVRRQDAASAALVAESRRLIEQTKARIDRAKTWMELMHGEDGAPRGKPD